MTTTTEIEFDKDFWDYFRSISPINTTPDKGTEAWRLREQIILNYLYLTKRIVAKMKKSMPSHVDSDDLESWATIGLMQAVQRYDQTMGVPFEAFCTQRARSVIMDGIRDADWAPRSLRKKQRDIAKAEEEFRQEKGREPTNVEISNRLEIPVEEISATKYRSEIASHTYIEGSLEAQNKPISTDSEEDELVDLLKSATAKAVATMPIRQAVVVAMHYYEDRKLSEIAKLLRTSEVKVGALHAEAVLKIWQALANAAIANDE